MIKPPKHLLEEVLAFSLFEGTCVGNVVEELTTSDELLNYVGNIFFFSAWLNFSGA